MKPPLLEVRGLTSCIVHRGRLLQVVRGIDLRIHSGEIVGLAGESGAGKTQLGLCLIGMETGHPGLVEGELRLDGRNLLDGLESISRVRRTRDGLMIEKDLNAYRRRIVPVLASLRGRRVSAVFQDPRSALDPLFTVGQHLAESMAVGGSPRDAADVRRRSLDALRQVELPHRAEWLDTYPHQLSGGMCQRLSVALALISGAELVVADEPTTALDGTLQARVLRLLTEARSRQGRAILLITHDLRLLAEVADRVLLMYAGRIVERTPAVGLLDASVPHHPYTRALGEIVLRRGGGERLPALSGEAPDPADPPSGCAFHPRCPLRRELPARQAEHCLRREPELQTSGESVGSAAIRCHWSSTAPRC